MTIVTNEPPTVEPPTATAPTSTGPNPLGPESYADKRSKLMALGEEYRQSVPHQVAALTWTVAELAEVTRQHSADAEAHTEELKRANGIAEMALIERHTANILAFYSMNSALFPAGVYDQMKVRLKISTPASTTPVAVMDVAPPTIPGIVPATADDFA